MIGSNEDLETRLANDSTTRIRVVRVFHLRGILLRATTFMSILTSPFFSSGCLSLQSVPDVQYVFVTHFQDNKESQPLQRRYALFEEVRVIGHDAEFPRSSHLTQARMCSKNKQQIKCRVPKTIKAIWSVPLLWAATTVSYTEHRFTIFSPGYASITVLPLGAYGRPPSEPEPENRWDSPGLLGGYYPAFCGFFHTKHATDDSVKTPLGCAMKEDGAFHSELPIKMLPPVPSLEETQLFVYQLWALAQAIERNHLNSVEASTRKLVYDAIRLQHDAFSHGIVEAHGWFKEYGTHVPMWCDCIRIKESPCRRIEMWVNPSSPDSR